MSDEITREQVEDFHARERGFESAHAERIYEREQALATARFVVEERERELSDAKDAVKKAELAAERARRRANG